MDDDFGAVYLASYLVIRQHIKICARQKTGPRHDSSECSPDLPVSAGH
jgi:hypothetical protein